MDFYEKEDFDRIVYTIDHESDGYPIIEHRLGNIVWNYAEPGSAGRNKMYVEGVELYNHKAGFGQWRELVETFDTEAEAEHALLLCHRFDMYENRGTDAGPWVFDDREDAENEACEMLEQDAADDDEPAAPAPPA